MKILKYLFILLIVGIVVYICYVVMYDLNKIYVKLDRCVDGDTAWFIIDGKSTKVRLLGINTPESTNYVEEYGIDASNYTCSMLESANDIYIEFDSNSEKYDKYDRLLGYVFVDNNNLSELLLSKGYAEVKYIYNNYKYMDDLCVAQEYAYVNKLGIWNISDYRYEDNYCYKNNY